MKLLALVRDIFRSHRLGRYRHRVREIHYVPFILPRFMAPAAEWNQLSEEMRGSSLLSRLAIAEVLRERRVIVLAEPGAGKSTWIHAAVLQLLDTMPDLIPIYAQLGNYSGSLKVLLENAGGYSKLKPSDIASPSSGRAYLLDGIDEVPDESIDGFCRDFMMLLSENPEALLITTCRQGFYPEVRDKLPVGLAEFNLLPFSTEDIAAFVSHENLNPDDFFRETQKSDFGLEASNPFTLGTLVSALKLRGQLEPLRSANLRIVVDAVLGEHSDRQPQDARRALRLLAIAMEVYARNALTRQEALRVFQEGMRISASEAERLLGHLSRYLLLITSAGYSFQMRSYGEYLAAEELASAPIDRILNLVLFPGTRRFNRSWANTASYLVEMHEDARRYFSIHYPDSVLNASPYAFSTNDRTQVVEAILKNLEDRDLFLIGHQTIPYRGLARFCQESDIPHLQARLNDPQASKLGNALILLGYLRDRTGLNIALTIAFDRTKRKVLRFSAFVALSAGATRELIPTLIPALDESDEMFDQVLDCIGALIEPPDIPMTLPLFGRTPTMLSTVFYRFASFRNIDALHATLDVLLANPTAVRNDHISSYAEFPLRLMVRLWNEEIGDKVAQLLLSWEAAGIYDSLIRMLPTIAENIRKKDPEGHVCRQVLSKWLEEARTPQYLIHTIAEICTPSVAHWLIGEGESGREMAARLVFYSHGKARRVLGSVVQHEIAAQDEYRDRYEREQREREVRQEQERNAARDAIVNAAELTNVLQGFRHLTPHEWPDLPRSRMDWLEQLIEKWSERFDCLASVSWTDSRNFQITGDFVAFRLLLLVIERYKLKLVNDVAVVQSLRGSAESGGAQPVIEYYKRCGFSPAAKSEFDRIFSTPTLIGGAESAFFEFLDGTDYNSPRTQTRLLVIANDASTAEFLRRQAAHLFSKAASDTELQTLSTSADVRNIFDDVLVRRQHVPTIKKRLSILLRDPGILRAAERPFPDDPAIQWIGHINTTDAWTPLANLWRQTLRLSLPACTRLVESTLLRLNVDSLIAMMRSEVKRASPELAEDLSYRAGIYEHQREIDAARGITFDQVVTQLAQNTTLKSIKVWCEGPTDTPAFKSLLAKRCTDRMQVISIQGVGGWANALNPHYNFGSLLDGCLWAVVVMDGDNGRDFTRSGRPISKRAVRLKRKLDSLNIPLRVLERYGIENYFARHALESVLGQDLTSVFPLPEDKSIREVIPTYDKNLNDRVIEKMSVEDLAGTDLETIIEEIQRWANV